MDDVWGTARTPTRDRQSLRAIGAVLAGLNRLLPPHGWHLKGSAAILGRIGPGARMPEDVDLSLPESAGPLLLTATGLPPGPGGERITVLRTEPVVFGSPGRATVHRVLVEVDGPPPHGPRERLDDRVLHDRELYGRELYDRVLLNVLLTPDDSAAHDTRTAPLAFPYGGNGPGAATVTVPAATLSRCLAQKLLRYTRRRESGKVNTRWSDLLDFLLVARCHRAPRLSLDGLRRDVAAEFAPMRRAWPLRLPPPPREWLDFWDTAVFRTAPALGRLPEAADRLAAFWHPVLERPAPPFASPSAAPAAHGDALWSPRAWRWEPGPDEPPHGRHGAATAP
ncbi:hypothetical protein [Streptomyces clavuligerus]|uniref:Nucleotidyl transferase AbiEii/AbiGii toxin family protein n=1 Tax=Streptomyces clavuligerus TaxID=1901 RepID=B5GY56_STRCL|nr:hypothetical protein [Streptomyces clavuligerus]ANW19396.1 hypothetical protein BB341_14800 [Streptomyces clavuligerus]AXU14004.1 hypothetical protein D1794_15445 [Streptomyces clavuligerus]EDY51263.1 hypothetical protein SSCG_04243 [Streptomyces clavuligerus]EFG07816.1 Hypothetical protein SCLAV_2744 [Streptomyces clavuligerus]MBY6303978.1 hypothetical protein [Streptomyces clavuligerus]